VKVDAVRLGDILELERITVDVDPDREYSQIGIKSFGNGIFHRDPCRGNQLSKLKYFEVHPNRLIVSNIMAWEGAIGISGASEKGFVGSARFLSYRPIDNVDIRYLNYYFQSPEGMSSIRSASTGTVARNQTLSPKNFENIKVNLPAVAQQRRIANKLDITLTLQMETAAFSMDRAGLAHSTIDAIEDEVFKSGLQAGWRLEALGEIAEINPRTPHPDGDETVAFVPMSALSDITGSIEKPIYQNSAEIKQGYKHFLRNDVIFARISPCMQNGKSAVFSDSESEHGFGSTEFHVIRTSSSLDSRWVHRYLRTRYFRDSAAAHMTGTAGQQRVPASFLRDSQIPIPRSTEEQEHALKKLDELQDKRLRFRSLHMSQIDTLKAIRSSLLNTAFTGQF